MYDLDTNVKNLMAFVDLVLVVVVSVLCISETSAIGKLLAIHSSHFG